MPRGHVEVGFSFLKNSNYGPFAYTDKSLINRLIKSKKTKFAIMINGSDFFKIRVTIKDIQIKNLKTMFQVFHIRIAAHYKDL